MPRPRIDRTIERVAISAALADRLEATGLSQDGLATRIGIPRLSLINYLKCRQTPRSRALGKLKAYFGPSFPYPATDASAPVLKAEKPIAAGQQSLALEAGGEILIETHDSLVSARLTRKRPNSLELFVEIRRTGSD
jgi:transcriptional regulator with XRE-family HTH domain